MTVGHTQGNAPPARIRGLLVLRVASAVGGAAQSLAGAAAGLLAAQVSGSEVTAGLPQACLVAGSAAAALLLSRTTAAHGRRTSLVAGAAAAALGCAVVLTAGATTSLPGVLAGNLLLGAGTATVMLTRYAAADLVDESRRARAMAAVLLSTTVGAVAGAGSLGPASSLGTRLELPALLGPYLLAGTAFAATATILRIGLTNPGPAATASAADDHHPDGFPTGSRTGLVVLGLANTVMVAVMTMAPVQLHHLGHGLTAIGAIISLHVAAMFAPSPLAARYTDRLGPGRAAATAGVLLTLACTVAAAGSTSLPALGTGMLLLGLGWNLALISGSVLLTSGVHPAARPRREGRGEVSMGLAAAGGSSAAGPLVAAGGYDTLAVAGALTAAMLLPAALPRICNRSRRGVAR